MKAAVCHEFGKPLVIEDLILASPQQGEVRVKLSACAICHSDIAYAQGIWGGTLPAVYGHEASGVVVELGRDVSGVNVGDHVIVSLIRSCGCCYYCSQGDMVLCEASFEMDQTGRLQDTNGKRVLQAMKTGAFAEEVVVDQSQVIPIAKDISLDSASLLACGVITGLGAVTRTAKVPTGSSVVVIGVGGVGLNSIQGARLARAHPIIALDINDTKLAASETFGATHKVNSLNEDAQKAVKALTNGRGADYVFVTVGSTKAMEQGIELLRRGGTIVLVGLPPVGAKLVIEAVNFADGSQHMMGSKMGSIRPKVDIPKLVELYREGRLKLDELITNRYPLSQINEAIDEVKRGEALRNVIVF
jgi:Zn-dependent alcohol dehydrogenase